MREVVQKVYKFNELEKKVQEKVLKRKRDTWVDGMDVMLEREYDYLTSDEYIIEQLMDEDENYEFYADGTEY